MYAPQVLASTSLAKYRITVSMTRFVRLGAHQRGSLANWLPNVKHTDTYAKVPGEGNGPIFKIEGRLSLCPEHESTDS